jgi:putative iron-dependent peroxidase
MVGRRKDGRPLVTRPVEPPEPDAFRFRVGDAEGLQCPRGAHIRRANPRDTLGWDVESGIALSKLHRLMRRGRVYAGVPGACGVAGAAPCGDAAHRSGCGKGLFFLALNADLERQFEFVQQRWIADATFNDLRDEDDAIVGAAGERAFSMPALPVGRRLNGFAQFTEVNGGGYFFVPSLTALRFMARPAQAVCERPSEPPRG